MNDGERKAPLPGEAGSSRLTSEDVIKSERRHEPRRNEDRVRVEALQARYAQYRRIALVAVTCYALVATVGIGVLFWLSIQKDDAVKSAQRASQQSAFASAKAASAASLAANASEKASAAAKVAESVSAGCRRASYRLALDVNNLRSDVANLENDASVLAFSIRAIPPNTAGAAAIRRAYAGKQKSIATKLREVRAYRTQIDPRDAYLLSNAFDRKVLRRSKFTCGG